MDQTQVNAEIKVQAAKMIEEVLKHQEQSIGGKGDKTTLTLIMEIAIRKGYNLGIDVALDIMKGTK